MGRDWYQRGLDEQAAEEAQKANDDAHWAVFKANRREAKKNKRRLASEAIKLDRRKAEAASNFNFKKHDPTEHYERMFKQIEDSKKTQTQLKKDRKAAKEERRRRDPNYRPRPKQTQQQGLTTNQFGNAQAGPYNAGSSNAGPNDPRTAMPRADTWRPSDGPTVPRDRIPPRTGTEYYTRAADRPRDSFAERSYRPPRYPRREYIDPDAAVYDNRDRRETFRPRSRSRSPYRKGQAPSRRRSRSPVRSPPAAPSVPSFGA